jgi:phage gpG-like protein
MVKIIQKGRSFRDIARSLIVATSETIPMEIRVMGLEWFDNSFRNQGFTNTGFQPWRARKKEKIGVRFGAKARKGSRGILIKSGRLRRSINARYTPNSIMFETRNIEYAEIHNTGGYAGRRLASRIPRRQYMGESQMLMDDIQKMILRELNKAAR